VGLNWRSVRYIAKAKRNALKIAVVFTTTLFGAGRRKSRRDARILQMSKRDTGKTTKTRGFRDILADFNEALNLAKARIAEAAAIRLDMTNHQTEQVLSDFNNHVWLEAHELILQAASLYMDCFVVSELADSGDAEDHKRKKELAALVNRFCRIYGVALRTEETDDPCVLFAVGSRDGHGRYVLENRATKKRTGSFKSLAEMRPLRLVSAPPRVEGFIQSRPEQFRDIRPVQAKGPGNPEGESD